MKVGEVLAQVNKIKPNTFDDDALLVWLNTIEAMVQTECLKVEPGSTGMITYTLPMDLDREMIMPAPYDQCYELYVESQIDYAQQEFATAQNTAALFNSAYTNALNYYVNKIDNNLKVVAKL